MQTAPLQLRYYFVPEFHMLARRTYDPKKKTLLKMENITCEVKQHERKANPLQKQIRLHLSYAPPGGENAPYKIKMVIIGFFEVSSKWPERKRNELVHINGPAMLYSAAREIIATMTGRGPWSQIILPSVNFLPDSRKGKRKL